MNDLPTDIVDEFDETDGHGVQQPDDRGLQETGGPQV